MKKKYNKLLAGLTLGILFPVASMILVYFFRYNASGIIELLRFLNQMGILTKVLSLSVIPNLLLFFVFIRTDKLLSARGVLFSTLIWAALIFIIYLIV